MSRKKLTAIVPVRQGSQRIKNKNFKDFAGKNLLRIKLEVLKRIDIIDSIVVNTDSEEALSMADEFEVENLGGRVITRVLNAIIAIFLKT